MDIKDFLWGLTLLLQRIGLFIVYNISVDKKVQPTSC